MTWGSETAHKRYSEKVDPKSRRRCNCGCSARATHRGMANGVMLMGGCALTVALWVKGGSKALTRRKKVTQ